MQNRQDGTRCKHRWLKVITCESVLCAHVHMPDKQVRKHSQILIIYAAQFCLYQECKYRSPQGSTTSTSLAQHFHCMHASVEDVRTCLVRWRNRSCSTRPRTMSVIVTYTDQTIKWQPDKIFIECGNRENTSCFGSTKIVTCKPKNCTQLYV